MRILYTTTIGGTMGFFTSFINELISSGNIVDIATNEDTSKVPDCYKEWGCKIYKIPWSRSPLDKENVKSIGILQAIITEGHYEIVHCHTPIAAACTRIACRPLYKCGKVKVIYTAHGFHFYKGAPLKNWLLYYPVEWLCAHWTDILITINKEDFDLAKHLMRAKKIEYVASVGIDVTRIANTVVDRAQKRFELGIPKDAFVVTSVGELIPRKNFKVAIDALEILKNEGKLDNIHLLICGRGALETELKLHTDKCNLNSNIHFLGYRNDVAEVYHCSDCCLFTSYQEGLGLAGLEGIAAGLPLICADNRGTREYDSRAIVVAPNNTKGFAEAIFSLLNDPSLCKQMTSDNLMICERFDISLVNKKMHEIYDGI